MSPFSAMAITENLGQSHFQKFQKWGVGAPILNICGKLKVYVHMFC